MSCLARASRCVLPTSRWARNASSPTVFLNCDSPGVGAWVFSQGSARRRNSPSPCRVVSLECYPMSVGTLFHQPCSRKYCLFNITHLELDVWVGHKLQLLKLLYWDLRCKPWWANMCSHTEVNHGIDLVVVFCRLLR